MAASDDSENILIKEFSTWQAATPTEDIFLIDHHALEEGSLQLILLLGGEHEVKLLCPAGYPDQEGHFFVEADPTVKLWANTLNEFLLDAPNKLSLTQVLNKAICLHATEKGKTRSRSNTEETEETEEEEISMGEEEEDVCMSLGLSDDDSAFTTEWELQVARKKKLWAQHEQKFRLELKQSKMVVGGMGSEVTSFQATGADAKQAKQIFTSCAASGILTNDLVHIMEHAQDKFTADPINNNIYKWCVKLFDFNPQCELAKDLSEIESKFSYNYIELELDFAIDLYPFYPPLVKVVRPRLQGSMMQRVTNMEILKLSYWNPTREMCNVLIDIKNFLQTWARLEVNSERNDRKRYPNGSYVDIDHHLLRLALVSEVNPRANSKYQLDVEKPPDIKPAAAAVLNNSSKSKKSRNNEEYWAAGVGYGHSRRAEWDIKAYCAAQKEKDKQIEAVLHMILKELKKLYAHHAPQLKPRKRAKPDTTGDGGAAGDPGAAAAEAAAAESIDPIEDMFNVLEGSALIPFIVSYLKADSFLEICRHTVVYKVIVDIVREIAMQPQLVPLLGNLPDQTTSIYDLLKALEQKATVLLSHICKAGNGSIPKPPKQESQHPSTSKKEKDKSHHHHHHHHHHPSHQSVPGTGAGIGAIMILEDPFLIMSPPTPPPSQLHPPATMENTAEEKLAREFQILFKDVTESFCRAGISPDRPPESLSSSSPEVEDKEGVEAMDSSTQPSTPNDDFAKLEALYKKHVGPLQFDTHDISLESSGAHNYSSQYKKQSTPTQAQVFRIAQEVTSLSTSLPLELSSSIFVRSDDEKLNLARALITGPEGTPYSSGCYQFDILFPSMYPKVPPMVNLQTTGGGTVRFNPNLYNCGKVCLSLLGTWEGQQGEQWNETTSTILQVLVSIQSLILVPDPYFNEPGYEIEIGTDAGKKHSAEYNADVRINNIKYAMIAQLQNPSPGFEDVIRMHFYLKKDKILQEVESWTQSCKSSKLERAYQNLKSELHKLSPPPNLMNTLSSSSSETITSTPAQP